MYNTFWNTIFFTLSLQISLIIYPNDFSTSFKMQCCPCNQLLHLEDDNPYYKNNPAFNQEFIENSSDNDDPILISLGSRCLTAFQIKYHCQRLARSISRS